jgi:hypothetical protein
MADERMICSQQSNNWYHFVNWLGYPETYGLQYKCWYRLPLHGNIRNARVGELWLVVLIDGHNETQTIRERVVAQQELELQNLRRVLHF